jgi:metallo-beta-lactamase family protein
MQLTFLGAAGEVTGSQHLLETDKRRILFDCGFFQGHRAEARAKNERFHCDPKNLDAVILSHAHIDHCGNLPGLYKAGFRGPIFCTAATADVAEIMLQDSAHIAAEDAKYLHGRLQHGHPPVEPLYDEQDARDVVKRFEPIPYGQWHELAKDVRLRFHEAGHILGSAITELEITDRNEMKRVIFTGDLGRRGLPLLRDPALIDNGCDVLITESTYGNRVHAPAEDQKAELLRIIKEAIAVEGKVIIPAFSLGRTQNVVYFLNQLSNEGRLPQIPVFVDSPLSRKLTQVYRHHQDEMDADVQAQRATDPDPFGFRGLTYIGSPQESRELNDRKGPFVVIASSGMCESGRVVHHIRHAVNDARNTIVLIGYQAEYTLGRRIQERQPKLRIFDRDVDMRAHVEVLNGLSAHADAEDFKWCFGHLAKHGGIGQAFIVHGEPLAANAVAELLRDECNEDPIIPQFKQSFTIK